MSTQTTARGIVVSFRLVGITAALAAGIAGFGTVGAGPAAAAEELAAPHSQEIQVAQVAEEVDLPTGKVPAKACEAMTKGRVPAAVTVKLGCIVIGDSGPITGGPLF